MNVIVINHKKKPNPGKRLTNYYTTLPLPNTIFISHSIPDRKEWRIMDIRDITHPIYSECQFYLKTARVSHHRELYYRKLYPTCTKLSGETIWE